MGLCLLLALGLVHVAADLRALGKGKAGRVESMVGLATADTLVREDPSPSRDMERGKVGGQEPECSVGRASTRTLR